MNIASQLKSLEGKQQVCFRHELRYQVMLAAYWTSRSAVVDITRSDDIKYANTASESTEYVQASSKQLRLQVRRKPERDSQQPSQLQR